AVIEDREGPKKERTERYFDPWYFVIMLLLELPGGRLRYDISKKKYHYLAYAGPVGKEGNHYLRRIIANTSSRADTREKGEGVHYDYRRATLTKTAKKSIRQAGQETRPTSRVREDAIQFAIELFRRQLKGRDSKAPLVLNLNAKTYEKLLRSAF